MRRRYINLQDGGSDVIIDDAIQKLWVQLFSRWLISSVLFIRKASVLLKIIRLVLVCIRMLPCVSRMYLYAPVYFVCYLCGEYVTRSTLRVVFYMIPFK